MLSLQPVLVHFFVDVDNVTLLQSQLPAGKSGSVYCFLSLSSSDPARYPTTTTLQSSAH